MIVFPLSVGTFFIDRVEISFIESAVSRIRLSISFRLKVEVLDLLCDETHHGIRIAGGAGNFQKLLENL